ncbi:PucR family transcriptional regulator, partial [Aduncisulcus paluster]
MSLTVHEALSLKALERFKLVAGANGLNNRISRVGLIDHETPEALTNIIMPQEFLFSNMIMIKDHPEQMIDYIESIIASKAACFALKTIFFDEFPDEVIEYANRHKFPLFTFDKTYIEDIILEVDQALNVYSQIAKLQGYVDEMTSSESDPIKVRSLALKLNKSFSSHFMVTTLEPQDT